jgi:hypothetical protein
MIVYQLKCSGGHGFEAWFRNGATYETQRADGDVECPMCGDTDVGKAPMAPHVAKSRSSDVAAERRAREVAREILHTVERLNREVEEKCDNVGDRFAEEARRIHNGDAKERGIYGEATDSEAMELDEDGVEFYRLPRIERRDN